MLNADDFNSGKRSKFESYRLSENSPYSGNANIYRGWESEGSAGRKACGCGCLAAGITSMGDYPGKDNRALSDESGI